MTTSPVTSITDELLAELEQLAGKATPGPWQWDGREVEDDGYVHIPECSYLVGAICLADNYEGYQDDCDFMAKANPTTILALLQHVRELTKDRERLDSLDKLCEAYGFEIHEGNRWVLDGPFRSVRDAIDSLPDDAARSSTT